MYDSCRQSILLSQPRSFQYGMIELFENEWIYFDNDYDEAYSLEEVIHNEMQFFISNQWMRGTLDIATVTFYPYNCNFGFSLEPYTKVRSTKKLQKSLAELLDSLPFNLFSLLLSSLNEWNYSIYDCIYCHNFSSFLHHSPISKGVNFLLFDNNEAILNVQHHFYLTKNEEHHSLEFVHATGLKCRYAV